MNIALEIRKEKSIYYAVKDHGISVTTLFYKNEGKFTKQQMCPTPELKEYEPFLIQLIRECKKIGFLVSKRRLARECSKYCNFGKIKTKERNKKIGNSNEKIEEI